MTDVPTLPVDPRTAELRQAVAALRDALADFRDAIVAVNNPDWREPFEASITVGLQIAELHSDRILPSLADDAVMLRSQFQRHAVPREDPELGPMDSLTRIRSARGALLADLDEVLTQAESLGLSPSQLAVDLPPAIAFERAGMTTMLDGLARRMRDVEEGLKAVQSESAATPNPDVRQVGLVNFYVNQMNVELALAKIEAVAKAIIDFANISRAIETMGELTRDFVASVDGMRRFMADGLRRAARAMAPRVWRLASGMRAIVGRVDRSAESSDPTENTDYGPVVAPLTDTEPSSAMADRVKHIVAEFADRENGDLYALAAATFLNTYLEYAQDYRRGYETTLQSRRSLVRALIAQMPWSDKVKAMAMDSLDHIGASLDDEFLQRATLASRLDDEADPLLAFRSGPLTHAFNRWIFGATRADNGKMRLPRWPFYEALARALREQGKPQREFAPLLRNLTEAWHVPNYLSYTDNGRADVAVDALAKAIWDVATAKGVTQPNEFASNRLNLHLARSYFEAAFPHHSREKPSPDRVNELVALAEARLAAATARDRCPVDVLRSAFDLLASHRQPIEAGEDGDGLALATLAERVKAHPATKAFDRAKIDLGLMRAQAKAGDAAALAAFTRLKPLALALFVKDHESIRIMQDLVRIIARDRDASFGMPAAADTADAPALQPLDRFVAFIVHAWGAMAAARIPTLRAKAAAPSAQNDHILSRYRDVVTRLDAMTEWHPSLADIRGFGAVRGAAARLADTPPDWDAIADMVTMLGNARPPFEGLGDKGTVAATSDDGDEEDEAGDVEAGDGTTA